MMPDAWMPMIRQHSIQSLPQRTTKGTVYSSNNANNALDRNPPAMSKVCETSITSKHGGTIVLLSKSTLWPDEDLQYAVETS